MKAYLFPGQGSQRKGMGRDLFSQYSHLTSTAAEILGYDIAGLCLHDADHLLNNTAYTQPALYVVSCLAWLHTTATTTLPAFLLGHSIGEYAALFAAGVFSFETGLELVKKRAALMAQATDGGMAAIVGLTISEVNYLLQHNGYQHIDVANHNSREQVVISGLKEDIRRAQTAFERAGAKLYYPMNVSGAFHSGHMSAAADAFAAFIKDYPLRAPEIPVISNVTGRPYSNNTIHALLTAQIRCPVRWYESISYLIRNGVDQFEEIGSGDVLRKMIPFIQADYLQAAEDQQPGDQPAAIACSQENFSVITAEGLGAAAFKKAYGLRLAYMTGAMVHGIASPALVIRMGKAGMMGFLGTGGVSPEKITADIRQIQQELPPGASFGVNLLNSHAENKVAEVILAQQVKYVEASAYITITEALVRLRLTGIHRLPDGRVVSPVRMMAKISRPEVAAVFMQPPPEELVIKLLDKKLLTADEAQLATEILMADDICVEADSGGHTDMGVAFILLPAIIRLRDSMTRHFHSNINIGAAGGIGTPEAAAAAFILGADFILTGSVNQCTVEAGTSDIVKDMLQLMEFQDTAYAPAGDMFETGAKVQVLRKGVLFHARAARLYELYKQYNSVDEIDEKTKQQIATQYFKRSFAEVFEDCRAYYPAAIFAEAMKHPKQMMAYLFRWYFAYSGRSAEQGEENHKTNFQVHCGPALGAFNQWVKDTPLENWRNRHSDEIGLKIMSGAATLLNERMKMFSTRSTEGTADKP
ncbi:ACP S-malonyltransferase [Chitinophaga sp. Mgbs1]|uniref:[acyl-carrier-protein] S-malonyltransferase n=1 Tax=Chitinophaga solisilvae TaxID=1233460 RepID=A0A433WN15_9BACT|nr:ACP S-malonyltransferase [Chitinophaga solisilvae]